MRQEHGFTQEDVAYNAGITVAALARIEQGRASPRWTTVMRIIGALGVSPAEFIAVVQDAPV
jgi:transcriptional regulator with XRE-family HTH domain